MNPIIKPNYSKSERGFTIIELMVSMVLVSVLLIGAYKMLPRTIILAGNDLNRVRANLRFAEITESIANDLNNVFVLVGGNATKLKAKTASTCGVKEIATSLRPLPGVTKESFSDSPLDPSGVDVESAYFQHDAIELIYLQSDSKPYSLAQAPDGAYFNNKGFSNLKISGETDFSAGDFALICDSIDCDVFRITNISFAEGITTLQHSDKSKWNLPFKRSFGFTSEGIMLSGNSIISHVNIATYAFSQRDHALVKNSHLWDDGFNPISKTFSNKQSETLWEPIAQGVDGLQIVYNVKNHLSSFKKTSSIRNPSIGEIGSEWNPKSPNKCFSQILAPELQSIQITLHAKGEKYTKIIHPTGLITGNVTQGAFSSFEKDALSKKATLDHSGTNPSPAVVEETGFISIQQQTTPVDSVATEDSSSCPNGYTTVANGNPNMSCPSGMFVELSLYNVVVDNTACTQTQNYACAESKIQCDNGTFIDRSAGETCPMSGASDNSTKAESTSSSNTGSSTSTSSSSTNGGSGVPNYGSSSGGF